MEAQTGSLTLANLVDPREKTYFNVLLGISILIWVCVVLSIIGLLAVGVVALIAWFAHGLLVARLRSEGVRITPEQYPALHQTFTEVCQRLGLAEAPDLYLLQEGGLLNAFATRHAGRNFVVLYSSFVEILGPSSPMIKFLIGHELGHLQRKHLTKRMFVAPGTIVPLLAEAYHRACESTCDRYGAFASGDLPASMMALTILASGREAASVDTTHFAAQHFQTRDFFVSWHELIIGYPTLSQRVAQVLGFSDPQYAQRPGRHILAYPFAFFFTLFSIRSLILVYISIVAISVLIALGNQVKGTQQAIQDQLQKQQQDQSTGH